MGAGLGAAVGDAVGPKHGNVPQLLPGALATPETPPGHTKFWTVHSVAKPGNADAKHAPVGQQHATDCGFIVGMGVGAPVARATATKREQPRRTKNVRIFAGL